MKIGFKSWRHDLKRYRIDVLTEDRVLQVAREPSVLPVTNCTRSKGIAGIPKNLYNTAQNHRFYSWCEDLDLKYGVISDYYGLLMCDEEGELYDVAPGKLSDKDKRQIASKIYFKMESIDKSEFLFFGLPPVKLRPYFKLMIITGMKIYYTTKLPRE